MRGLSREYQRQVNESLLIEMLIKEFYQYKEIIYCADQTVAVN